MPSSAHAWASAATRCSNDATDPLSPTRRRRARTSPPSGGCSRVIGSLRAMRGQWNLEPLQLAPTIAVAVLYGRRVRTLAVRGTPVPLWRRLAVLTGIAVVFAALASPIDAVGEEDLFFVHMTQHVMLGDLAPLCFVAGLTGPVLRPVLGLPGVDRLRVLAHPLVALPLWTVNLYVWH